MATTGTDKHCRLCLMLNKGGTQACYTLLLKRVEELTPTGHQPDPWTIHEFLQTKKKGISKSNISKEKLQVLFPRKGVTDPSKWDLSLLCTILTIHCDLEQLTRLDVERLRTIRNKLCHMNDPNIDDKAYKAYFEDIKVVVTRILQGNSDDKTKQAIEKILKDIHEGPLSLVEAHKELHTFYSMDMDMREKLENVQGDVEHVLQKVERFDSKLDQIISNKLDNESCSRLNSARNNFQIPGVEVFLDLKNLSTEEEQRMSTVLEQLFEEVINEDEDFISTIPPGSHIRLREAVRKTFKLFLMKGWRITSAKHECVCLQIRCLTFKSLAALFREHVQGQINVQLADLNAVVSDSVCGKEAQFETVIYKDEFWSVMDKTISAVDEFLSDQEMETNPTLHETPQHCDGQKKHALSLKASNVTHEGPHQFEKYCENELVTCSRLLESELKTEFAAPHVSIQATYSPKRSQRDTDQDQSTDEFATPPEGIEAQKDVPLSFPSTSKSKRVDEGHSSPEPHSEADGSQLLHERLEKEGKTSAELQIIQEEEHEKVKADVSKRFLERLREEMRTRRRNSNTNGDSISAENNEMDKVPEEIDNDPYTRRLYTKALQDGKETERSIRINVVGNFSQGKTTLVRRLVGESIEGVETTNGLDIDRYRCKVSQDGSLYCEKTNNDDKTSALNRLCVIASSLESEEVEHIGQSSEIDEIAHAHEKDNCGQSPIDFEINDEFLSFSHQKQSETRAEVVKTENEIPAIFDIWDFGGQYIFYATHTMFHSRNAIYLLVMDVSLGMGDIILDEDFPAETGDRNMEYFIKFWMNSIHSFVGTQSCFDPPVILVGTHKDQIPGNENEKQQYTEEYFEKVKMLFDNTDVLKHIHSIDFAVDNTSLTDTGIDSLRKEIIKMGTTKAEMVQIPAKWIPLEEALHKRRNENIIPFDEVKNIDAKNAFPLVDEEHIKLFLQYHHAKGTLFYFDEEPVSEYVVINPQYLIDAFKCIITSERFCKKDPKIRPLWSRLVKEAILENDLIDFQWRRDDDKHFMTNRTILLSLLKKHHIISEVMNFDEQNQTAEELGWYIVPSLLKNRITHRQIDDFFHGKKNTFIRIALRFENSAIIPSICHRLFAAALGRWCVASFHNQLLLFEDFAVFRLDMFQVGIIRRNLKDRAIELQVLGLGCSAYLGDTFRRFTEAVVNHEFRKFNTTEDLQTPYQLFYRCNHESHGIDGSDLVELSHMESKHNVPCPDLENHTIPVVEAKAEWFLEDKVLNAQSEIVRGR